MSDISKALRVITANNPSPLTGPGTNSFLLGRTQIAVIDPGPDLPAHREALLAAAAPGRITHIFVTHPHLDHSGGARALAQATGAPILAFGTAEAGRSALMAQLAANGALAGGEGLDHAFAPDQTLRDGECVACAEWALTALHTPGHQAGHLSFLSEDVVFCGDIAMAWSSTLISPPDGDLTDYFRSLVRLKSLDARQLLPAHGAAIDAPGPRLDALVAHRNTRTAQILAALRDGPASADSLAQRIYDIPAALQVAAARNVLAHLIALTEIGAIAPTSPLSFTSNFALKP